MQILMPQLGETVDEGTVITWFKKVGDEVKHGDNLFEIETDKVSMEVQATEEGVLSRILVAEGETASVGAVVAVIGDDNDATATVRAGAGDPAVGGSQATIHIQMPQLGETVTGGTITTWFKKAGDEVKHGDNLFEIETDKVSMEVQATEQGVLTRILVGEGETASVGATVAIIGDDDGSATVDAGPGNSGRPAPLRYDPKPADRAEPASGHLDPFNEVRTPVLKVAPCNAPGGIRVTPLARRLIAENGVDLVALAQAVQARGGRRITKADVQLSPAPRAASSTPAAIRVSVGANDTVVDLNPIRARTAKRLAQSWQTIPHVAQAVEIDYEAANEARLAAKQSVHDRHGISLTYLPFIARAVCLALRDFPDINAAFDGTRLVRRADVNLGIAVNLDGGGLVVPVIRDADEMTVTGLARAMDRLAKKARADDLATTDVEGGTYTITNNGSFGTAYTAPIINPPQVAILSTDGISQKPAVIEKDGKSAIEPRLRGMIVQSFDHRAFDGAYSGQFLARVRQIIETRDWSRDFD